MTLSAVSRSPRPNDNAFSHEALFYTGQDGFAEGTLSFLRQGAAAHEPMLVVVDAPKIALLRSALGTDAHAVHFADMADVGHNPARIIPAWREFVDAHAGKGSPLRGIGEPIYPARSAAELVECQQHESLLNLAFADAPAFRLLCPYDTKALAPDVIAEARRSHPILVDGAEVQPSTDYCDVDEPAPLPGPLPEPHHRADELSFGAGALGPIRALVSRHATEAGLLPGRTADLVLAVNEVATNSLRHGGGSGALRVWRDDEALVCEVRDRGRIEDPLVGRERPAIEQTGGRGIWMVNQLCDLVQIRSSAEHGTVVRMHVQLPRLS
jgi:anti-sigma regulatory factor (Ser/Thr protein kinase)